MQCAGPGPRLQPPLGQDYWQTHNVNIGSATSDQGQHKQVKLASTGNIQSYVTQANQEHTFKVCFTHEIRLAVIGPCLKCSQNSHYAGCPSIH